MNKLHRSIVCARKAFLSFRRNVHFFRGISSFSLAINVGTMSRTILQSLSDMDLGMSGVSQALRSSMRELQVNYDVYILDTQ